MKMHPSISFMELVEIGIEVSICDHLHVNIFCHRIHVILLRIRCLGRTSRTDCLPVGSRKNIYVAAELASTAGATGQERRIESFYALYVRRRRERELFGFHAYSLQCFARNIISLSQVELRP